MVVGIAGAPARFEIGRVISRTFDVIGKNPVTFFGLSFLLSIPYWLFSFYGVLSVYFGVGSRALVTRESLTQPPAGYQTPSPNFAYGTGPKESLHKEYNPSAGKYGE